MAIDDPSERESHSLARRRLRKHVLILREDHTIQQCRPIQKRAVIESSRPVILCPENINTFLLQRQRDSGRSM